ncbi:hypothetical protein [Roseisolibacter sp. H3M3-2]|uniref:hypothetical protein n=1 Tax=Roseisolibacter sp. H3M3-2 TaxID=3031323 RepID=UPI0023D997FC|nr:hypothetical protein [Roseisolibacter sp. H3M3-2]MDF1502920.1 hypothetical protein [Roseisolibacter sp. H3M3-2]
MPSRLAPRALALLPLALAACADGAPVSGPQSAASPARSEASSVVVVTGGTAAPLPCAQVAPGFDFAQQLALGITARVVAPKSGEVVSLDLDRASAPANVRISPDARLQERRGVLTGRGTIAMDVYEGGVLRVTLVSDLSEATGTLAQPGVNADGTTYRQLAVSFPARRADGTVDLQQCPSGATLLTRGFVLNARY